MFQSSTEPFQASMAALSGVDSKSIVASSLSIADVLYLALERRSSHLIW